VHNFAYHKPTSLADAAALLSANEDAKLLAGGMTYIPTLKQRLAQPSDVVDLSGIAELRKTQFDDRVGRLVIGAMTTHGEVARSELVKARIPALAALASHIGDPQVRNRGTIGGSISNNDPAADYPGALLGLGAVVFTDKRQIPADDFFTGMFETALERDEIVVDVRFPVPEKAAYAKFPNPASRYAMAGVFVAKVGGEIRVAVTGAGQGGAYRWQEAEAALAASWSPAALDGLTVDPGELNSDIHASAEYRAHLVKVMAKRAVAAAG
jgi:carbon-monoxide dehydrogenase medium subunit